MILKAARLAMVDLFAPESRSAFWKVVGLTILMLIGLWFAITGVFSEYTLPWLAGFFPDMPEWAGIAGILFAVLASLGLALGLAFLIAPISVVIAGFFLDDVAEAIERKHYSGKPAGRALKLRESVPHTLKFLGVVILGNLFAVTLLLVPIVNIAAFFIVNAYLLSREFFEFAAMRYHPRQQAKDLRAKHSTTVFFAGLLIAGFLAIPILNLLTPLFAAGLMVHLHQLLVDKDPEYELTPQAATAAPV